MSHRTYFGQSLCVARGKNQEDVARHVRTAAIETLTLIVSQGITS